MFNIPFGDIWGVIKVERAFCFEYGFENIPFEIVIC
jgi:hypothetical protein